MPNAALTYFQTVPGATASQGAQTGKGAHGMSDVSNGAHWGTLGIVVLAALLLIVLDRAGFRFVVTVGKR